MKEKSTAQPEMSGQMERFFMQSPAGICVLDGPDLIFERVNPNYQQLFPGRDLLGKKLLEAVPEIKDQSIWNILQEVYHKGKTYEGNGLLIPLVGFEGGPVEDRYFNFIYQPRLDADGLVDGIMVFVFEVTNMVKVERRLEASEKHLDFLLNAMPQQVWTALPNGELNYVNEVICADFGRSATDIIGAGWQAFIHPEDLQGCLTIWKTALETRTEYMVEFRLLMNDGQYKWHLARAIPMIQEEDVKFWMGTNTNIDTQKNNEQKKDEFLSIASHELKTPLTTIKAFNQLMKRTTDVDKLHEYIGKSSNNILRLEKLIGDLLDVTRINAGKMKYTMKKFDFKQMLIESVESVQYTASNHQLIIEKAVPVNYIGDRFRIEQVLNNFLSNAVKYSPQGGEVRICCELQLDNIIVSVQDFGIGIANQDLSRLFERYYRVDNTAMRFEGLGLGLFISSEILKGHHGSFWIESERGKGSTFYFRLPLNNASKDNGLNVSKPSIDKDDFYQDNSITVVYNPVYQRLDVDWTGFQSFESVQHGGMVILEMLKRNNCSKIINDNRHVLGTWSEAAEWAGEEWFPMVEKAGLKYFAWIYSPSAFSQLSAKKSVDNAVGNVVTQFFTDIVLAQDWLNGK